MYFELKDHLTVPLKQKDKKNTDIKYFKAVHIFFEMGRQASKWSFKVFQI